ncbi:MAG TPA: hypothetical protein VL443_24010 [Cyclobacteriaceae bacterium]|jgi:hypothetical protein|nr:hypothetical protein [Cyclobacteriaceae bacterium]
MSYRYFPEYGRSGHGKPHYTHRKMFVHIVNAGYLCGWIAMPTQIWQWMLRQREGVFTILVTIRRKLILVITQYRTESKQNRKSYLNSLIVKLS